MVFPAADWVEHHARVKSGACALRSADTGETRSWGELDLRVGRLAHGLRYHLGLAPGDRVTALMDGDIRSFELQFACMRAGIILAPLNIRLAVPELTLQCNELEPGLMINTAALADTADAVRAGANIPKQLLTAPHGGAEFDELIARSGYLPASRSIDPNAVTHILYTSGTTGSPKGAMSTHSTLIWQAMNQIQFSRVAEEGSHVFSPVPLFHAGGLNSLSNPILYFGGQVSIASRFDPGSVVRFMVDPANKVTHVAFGVVMYQMLTEVAEFENADFSGLRLALIAGAHVPEALRAAYRARGITFSSQYGSTETGPTVTALDPNATGKASAGSCGQKVMNTEVRLVGADGRDVDDGNPGEIWVRGPSVTAGYWKRDPSATFTDGWFATGDVACKDVEGYYYIVDRLKDMYKSGGENVSSLEVESVLTRHPDIAECAVIGVPDPKWGEVGLAIVRPVEGAQVSLETVRQACDGLLARYKFPRYVEIVDSFPRNVTGKISKADLRKQFGRVAA